MIEKEGYMEKFANFSNKVRLLSICLWFVILIFSCSKKKGDDSVVKITTKGDLQIVQDLYENQITITAIAELDEIPIEWQIEGPGKNFVFSNSTQEGRISRLIIGIKRPVPYNWIDDTEVFVSAFPQGNNDPSKISKTTVKLLKFRRNGVTAPGSSPIRVRISKSQDVSGYSFVATPLLLEVSKDSDFTDQHSDEKSNKAELKIFYHRFDDRGLGTYSIRESVEFAGTLRVSASYEGIGHDATFGVATGVAARIDNSDILIDDNTLGIRYQGYPNSLTLSLKVKQTNQGKSKSQAAGISVNLTLVNQKSFSDEKHFSGSYIIEEQNGHLPGSEIIIQKQVYYGASIYLEQTDDNEWSLKASANIRPIFPANEKEFTEILFVPSF